MELVFTGRPVIIQTIQNRAKKQHLITLPLTVLSPCFLPAPQTCQEESKNLHPPLLWTPHCCKQTHTVTLLIFTKGWEYFPPSLRRKGVIFPEKMHVAALFLWSSFHQDCTASPSDRLSLKIPVRCLFFLHLIHPPGRFYLTMQLQGRRRKIWEPSQGWRIRVTCTLCPSSFLFFFFFCFFFFFFPPKMRVLLCGPLFSASEHVMWRCSYPAL